jgi:hypothetical protein
MFDFNDFNTNGLGAQTPTDALPEVGFEHIAFAMKLLSLNPSPAGFAAAFGLVARVMPEFAIGVLEVVEQMAKDTPELLNR